MTRARIELEPVWLLARRPYRETSELLEVFSANHGRVGLVARGARGPKARQRGLHAPFRPLLLSWLEAGDLGTMTGAEPAGPDIELAGERIFHGWYLNELLLKLLPRHDPHPALHEDYGAALHRLTGDETQAEAALRVFEKRLLEQLGYGLPLEADFEPARDYALRPESGFVPATAAGEARYAGASLAALRDEALATRAALRDARRLLRAALEPHLPLASLKTPRLLRELRAATPAAKPAAPDD